MLPTPTSRRAGGSRGGALALLASAAALASLPAAAGSKDPPAGSAAAPARAPSATATSGAGREVALLAGGCFWGMQELLRKIPGVLETEAGYTGGWLANPRYEDTHGSRSGHAEAVRVVFDPTRLSFADLLEHWFFRMHDPTTPNRQGNDTGTQYRSAIFYADEAQRLTAEAVKARVQASGKWKGMIVTEIAKAGPWYPAEPEHQDYLKRNPGGYTCHWLRT
jgi:methionine-S-sulfoxide reductase